MTDKQRPGVGSAGRMGNRGMVKPRCREQHSKGAERCQELRAVNGKVVARIEGNVLRKSVDASRHFLREPRAIAFDQDNLTKANRADVQWVEVFDRESRATYRATLDDFHQHGFCFDRGHGRQVALPLPHWQVLRPGAARQLALDL